MRRQRVVFIVFISNWEIFFNPRPVINDIVCHTNYPAQYTAMDKININSNEWSKVRQDVNSRITCVYLYLEMCLEGEQPEPT